MKQQMSADHATAPDPDEMVSDILGIAGLKRCPHIDDPQRVLWCCCLPGQCEGRAIATKGEAT